MKEIQNYFKDDEFLESRWSRKTNVESQNGFGRLFIFVGNERKLIIYDMILHSTHSNAMFSAICCAEFQPTDKK